MKYPKRLYTERSQAHVRQLLSDLHDFATSPLDYEADPEELVRARIERLSASGYVVDLALLSMGHTVDPSNFLSVISLISDYAQYLGTEIPWGEIILADSPHLRVVQVVARLYAKLVGNLDDCKQAGLL